MADGTTDNAYSQALQQILGQPSQPGVFGYGFSNSDIQRLQAAGISPQQLMQLGLSTQPQTTASAYQSGGGGGPTTSPTAGGIQQGNNAALLGAMLKLGGGQQQQTGPPTPGNAYGQAYPLYAQDAQGNPTGKPTYANPANQASLLGAAALQMPAVINPPPSGTPSSVSGVAPTGGALIGSTVPSVGGWTWPTVQSAFQLQPRDIAEFQKQGLAPQQVASNLLGSSWNPTSEKNLMQGLGWQSRDIAQFKAMGLTPQQAASKMGQPLPQVGAPTPAGTPGMTGPWANQPGLFMQAPRTAPTVAAGATPLTAAAQPTATAYNPTATPFAQAPPAPGLTPPTISPQLLAAHTTGLEDAGKALFAHFGGDPNSASHADITNFHNQLTSAIGGVPTAGPSPMANPLASGPPQPIPWQQAWAGQHGLTNPTPGSPAVQLPPGVTPPYAGFAPSSGFNPKPWTGPGNIADAITAASGPIGMSASNTATALAGLQGTPPTATKKMRSGGVVPGRGNKDTVPALLTPGEYVIPKDQVAQFFGGRTPAKMAGGGFADPDPDPDPNAPPEARRKTLSAQTSQAPPPAAPGGSSIHSGLASGLASAAHTYANSINNFAGAGTKDIRNTPLDPDPDLPYLKAAGMAGGAGSGRPTANALSGIGAGLTQAAQAIASSVGPWQVQQSAIPDPSQFQRPPTITFSPQRNYS